VGVVVAKQRRKKFNSELKKVANNKELAVHVLGVMTMAIWRIFQKSATLSYVEANRS
jgi:hypothetical protein